MNKIDTDIKLVKKAVRGNSDAYGELIRQQQEYLYKMAYVYTENQQDALDIPDGSVKANLSRGRKELKKYLKEDYMYAESV